MSLWHPLCLSCVIMPGTPRYAVIQDGSTFHVTWQCHNKDWLLKEEWAKRLYYQLLLKYKDRYQVQIYSYCFMSNHPHLTGYCQNKDFFSDFFRVVNSCFAKSYNRKMKRRGQVVMDRFKSPHIQTEAEHLKVMYYIDLNPKRAGMVDHPKEYAWSSYHYYALGKEDPLITEAPSYHILGSTASERQKAYQKMVEEILKNDWKTKQPYSSLPFIGNPDWVRTKVIELRSFERARFEEWKERYKKKFYIQNTG